MLKNDLLWHPWKGVLLLTFLMFLGIRPPSGAQEASRGSPGVPTATPSTICFVIFCRFLVDFDEICTTFGCSRKCPSHRMNVKIWAAFPLRLKCTRVSKFGQHSPSDSATKMHIKIWTAFRPAFQKCQGANRYLTLPEYHA